MENADVNLQMGYLRNEWFQYLFLCEYFYNHIISKISMILENHYFITNIIDYIK